MSWISSIASKAGHFISSNAKPLALGAIALGTGGLALPGVLAAGVSIVKNTMQAGTAAAGVTAAQSVQQAGVEALNTAGVALNPSQSPIAGVTIRQLWIAGVVLGGLVLVLVLRKHE